MNKACAQSGRKDFKASLCRDMPWQSPAHRVTFLVCAACLSLYLAYALFLAHSAIFVGWWETIYSLLWFGAYAAAIFVLFCCAGRRLSAAQWANRSARAERGKASPAFWAISMGITLVLAGISFAAIYPGAVTYDVYNQWMQLKTGWFNTWHPVPHTLLLGLGSLVSGGSYSAVVVLQILAFGAALAYLLDSLRQWGVSKWLLIAMQVVIVQTPLVSSVLMSAGKDNAMTLGVMVLCAQSMHLYFSGGAWVRKPRNAIAFGLALAFVTLVRHNGFFYTVPLLVCAFLVCAAGRKRIALSAAVMAAACLLTSGLIHTALYVVQPEQMLGESIGIPMTVLFDIRAENPEVLDDETHEFLQSLIEDEAFEKKYVKTQYNSIKFEWPLEEISHQPPEKLLGMALRTAISNPRSAFQSINGVTDLVWDVCGNQEGVERAGNSGDLSEYPHQNTRVNQWGRALQGLLSAPFDFVGLQWLCRNIGVQMALLLLCTLWALYRNGTRSLLFAVPMLGYNLATMLLLCGNDARFFQFTMVVSLPGMCALFWKPDPDTSKTKQ